MEITMKVIMNLVRRVRLKILATQIRLLNVWIGIAVIRQTKRGRRLNRLILRSTVLGGRYCDLEETT